MGIQHSHFLKVAPTLGSVNSSIPHGNWSSTVFQILFFLNLEYSGPSYLPLEFLFHEKFRSLKIPQEFLV
jgi:hypothetical protein